VVKKGMVGSAGALAVGGLATAALAFAGPAAAAGGSTSSSESYGPGGDFITYCVDGVPLEFGGGCFRPVAGATSVQATLRDAVSTNTAGEIQFQDAAGRFLGASVGFCGQSPQVPIPSGTAEIFVVADGPMLAQLAEKCGAASSATVGTVTLTQFFPA
jgi:hypothetical protein